MDPKLNYLNSVKHRYSDIIVHYKNNTKGESWTQAKPLGKLTDEEVAQVNLIRVLPNQIVLDIENLAELSGVIEKIKQRGWGYEVWNTGSRGAHVYLEFDNLEEQTLEVRNRIRKYIITMFGTDEALAKESQFVSCPYANHFKTDKQKIVVERIERINKLPEEIVEFAKKDVTEQFSIMQPDEMFKNFLQDPCLLYILGHTIEDGERNDILFKNLAIGLVRHGLPRSEIVRIAQIIVNNCPGKNMAEFMGWVDKALRGEVKDFNKFELARWGLKYGYGKFYSEEELKDVNVNEYGSLRTIEMLWSELWDSRIVVQEDWKKLCFYNLLGTILDEREDDYRIHVIFSSPPGSGKDEGLNLVEEILKKMEYNTHRPSSATDRSLVGSVNPTAIEWNTKYADKIDSGDKQKKMEIEYGLLSESHWIAFGESESVFKPSQWNNQLHVILRQAMDRNRTVERVIGGRPIKVYTNTSFLLTTYSMDTIIYGLLNNGLFQRALYFDRTLEKDDYIRIRNKVSDNNFDNVVNRKETEKELVELLIQKLKQMKEFYNTHKKITQYNKCNEDVKHIWNMYDFEYAVLSKVDRYVMDTCVVRGGNNLKKLATLIALSEFRCHIEKSDIYRSFGIIKKCLDSLKALVARQGGHKKLEDSILRLLSQGEYPKMRVYKEMDTQLGVKSLPSQIKHLNKLIAKGYIYEKTEGNSKLVGLTDNGRNVLEVGEYI